MSGKAPITGPGGTPTIIQDPATQTPGQAPASVQEPGSGGKPTPAGGTPRPDDDQILNDLSITVKDGIVSMPQGKFDFIKNDMLKFRRQRNDAREESDRLTKQLSEIAEKQKKEQNEKLLAEGKYKELAEKKEQEATDLQAQLNEEKINNALKIKALEMGIADIDGLKLADRSKISIDPDSNQIIGIDEVLKDLKESKGYLFEKQESKGPGVDTGKPGKAPAEQVKKADMLRDAKLARQIKSDDPARYDRIIKNGVG